MNRPLLGRPIYATGLMALGILDLIYRDTVMWKVLPSGAPERVLWSLGSGVLLIAAGAALLSSRFKTGASRVLLVFLLLWDLLIGIPPVVATPEAEVNWLVLGMMTIVVVAAWLLIGTRHPRAARVVVGLCLIPVGLSHFFYLKTTIDLVPPWMPARALWAYLVGAAHVAAGLGVLFGIWPRLAAMAEAGMLMGFAILVWVPRVITSPGVHFNWTELLGTWVIGAAVWVVADSYTGIPWLSLHPRKGD